MSAPGKAVIIQLDNPVCPKPNQQVRTKRWTWEVTNMWSQRGGGRSAITKVKEVSLEITNIAQGEGIHDLETRNEVFVKVRISRRVGV